MLKDGGLAYSQIEPLSIKIIPIRRVIRSGIPAQIFTTWCDQCWDIWAEEEVIVSQQTLSQIIYQSLIR